MIENSIYGIMRDISKTIKKRGFLKKKYSIELQDLNKLNNLLSALFQILAKENRKEFRKELKKFDLDFDFRRLEILYRRYKKTISENDLNEILELILQITTKLKGLSRRKFIAKSTILATILFSSLSAYNIYSYYNDLDFLKDLKETDKEFLSSLIKLNFANQLFSENYLEQFIKVNNKLITLAIETYNNLKTEQVKNLFVTLIYLYLENNALLVINTFQQIPFNEIELAKFITNYIPEGFGNNIIKHYRLYLIFFSKREYLNRRTERFVKYFIFNYELFNSENFNILELGTISNFLSTTEMKKYIQNLINLDMNIKTILPEFFHFVYSFYTYLDIIDDMNTYKKFINFFFIKYINILYSYENKVTLNYLLVEKKTPDLENFKFNTLKNFQNPFSIGLRILEAYIIYKLNIKKPNKDTILVARATVYDLIIKYQLFRPTRFDSIFTREEFKRIFELFQKVDFKALYSSNLYKIEILKKRHYPLISKKDYLIMFRSIDKYSYNSSDFYNAFKKIFSDKVEILSGKEMFSKTLEKLEKELLRRRKIFFVFNEHGNIEQLSDNNHIVYIGDKLIKINIDTLVDVLYKRYKNYTPKEYDVFLLGVCYSNNIGRILFEKLATKLSYAPKLIIITTNNLDNLTYSSLEDKGISLIQRFIYKQLLQKGEIYLDEIEESIEKIKKERIVSKIIPSSANIVPSILIPNQFINKRFISDFIQIAQNDKLNTILNKEWYQYG